MLCGGAIRSGGIGQRSVDLLLSDSGGGLLRRWVRSRIEARRIFCNFRNLRPEEVIVDKLPHPP